MAIGEARIKLVLTLQPSVFPLCKITSGVETPNDFDYIAGFDLMAV